MCKYPTHVFAFVLLCCFQHVLCQSHYFCVTNVRLMYNAVCS
uniref:Uncharacterized protein n=1 Tax=Anguilla anguilla TaxID=7936 RepID=A0A0E9UCJ4_ANGAN